MFGGLFDGLKSCEVFAKCGFEFDARCGVAVGCV